MSLLTLIRPPADLPVEGGEDQTGVEADQGVEDRAQVGEDPDHVEQNNDGNAKESDLEIVVTDVLDSRVIFSGSIESLS